MTLEDIVYDMYYKGKTCIQIQKYLRDNNMIVSYIEVKKIFMHVLNEYYKEH